MTTDMPKPWAPIALVVGPVHVQFGSPHDCRQLLTWLLQRLQEQAPAEAAEWVQRDAMRLCPTRPVAVVSVRAGRVIGCSRCGKPAALVDDVIPADGLCPWCRAEDSPGVNAAVARERRDTLPSGPPAQDWTSTPRNLLVCEPEQGDER